MNPESSLKLQTLEKFPVLMTKEKVAEALGVATHTIPPLVRSGLLKPLGQSGRYCVKHFSRDALAEKFASPEWLDKVAAAIHRHWRNKNARKRARQRLPAKIAPRNRHTSALSPPSCARAVENSGKQSGPRVPAQGADRCRARPSHSAGTAYR